MRQSKWNLKEPWRGGHILVREGWRPERENPRYSVTLRLFICSEDKDRPSADKMTHSCFVDIDILLNLSLTFPTKQCDKWVWIDDFFSRNFDLFCLLYLPHSDPFCSSEVCPHQGRVTRRLAAGSSVDRSRRAMLCLLQSIVFHSTIVFWCELIVGKQMNILWWPSAGWGLVKLVIG